MTAIAICFVLSLILWAGIMLYAWSTTYPMFRGVGAAEFAQVHDLYERGLPVGVYVPFALMGLTVCAAIVLTPTDIPRSALALGAVALVGGVVTTAFCAAPMHIRLIRQGKDAVTIERMVKCNAWRAIASLIGLAAAVLTLTMGR